MQVGKNNISQFLTTNNDCFIIPVYQRNYDWNEDNCKQLWEDIKYMSETPKNTTHFLGTICSSGTVAHEKSIIDGQQRLTTVTLLIKAIYDSSEGGDFKTDLKKFLLNSGYGIQENHRIKLQLNTRDDQIYRKLLKSEGYTSAEDIGELMFSSRLYQNYTFFFEIVKDMDLGQKLRIVNALEKLIIVELDIENEDPQEIFESLNSTGLDLTAVDLLRNYLLMSLDRETQERLYNTYWYHIEENVGPTNMVRFFIDYYIYVKKSDAVMIRGRRAHINVDHLYEGFKEYYKTLGASTESRSASKEITEKLLSDMFQCSKLYKELVFADKIDMNSLDEMQRVIYSIVYLNEVVSSRPILMYILNCYREGEINDSQKMEMLNACLSMVFRSKVTKSKGLNGQFVGNMLLRISEEKGDIIDRFWNALTSGKESFAFPSDKDFRNALINRQIFDILRSKGTKYLLYSLEQNSPAAKGLPRYDDPNITIEHIMPKSLTPDWRDYLGDSASLFEDNLNKLGNLTLTNNNSEMSNKSFDEKKGWYSESSYHYTRELAKYTCWNMKEISRRSELLADRCLMLWAFPKKYSGSSDSSDTIKRKPPFRFSMIGLANGDIIEFIGDHNKTATVYDDTRVTYQNKKYSLSTLASELIGKKTSLNGTKYFLYNGETLDDLREEHESNIL